MSAWRGTAWGPLRVGLKIQNKSIEGKRRGRGEKTGEQNPEAGVGAGTPGGGQSTFQGHRSWPRPQLQAWPVGRTRGCVQAARRAGGGGGSCTGRGGGCTTPFRPAVTGPRRLCPEHRLYGAPQKTHSGRVPGMGTPQAHGLSAVRGRPAGPAASPPVLQAKYSSSAPRPSSDPGTDVGHRRHCSAGGLLSGTTVAPAFPAGPAAAANPAAWGMVRPREGLQGVLALGRRRGVWALLCPLSGPGTLTDPGLTSMGHT